MARPNKGKTSEYVNLWVHKDLLCLLNARKEFLKNDGQLFANKVSMGDISKEFVAHYWRLAGASIIGHRMKKYFTQKTSKNI